MTDGPPGNDNDEGTPRGNLLIFVAFVVIVVIGFFIIWKLHDYEQLQNCLISGRRDCESVDIPSSR